VDLNFKTIAVIGASENLSKVGSIILKNIIDSGFKGNVFAVNPKYEEILGIKCFKTISDIREKIDLAVFAIPAVNVIEVFNEIEKGKLENALIISAGFHENGDASMENELINIAKEKSIRIIGPNTLGLIDVKNNLNASFGKAIPNFEKVSIVSQSGALMTILMDLSKEFNFGFSKMFSIGDKVDVSENELIKILNEDENTEVIAGYFETLNDEEEFINLIKNSNKRFIFLKPITSKEAKEFAQNHTGKIEDSDLIEVYKKAGAIIVESMEDMFFTLMGLSWLESSVSNNIGIITNAGGPSEILTDNLSKLGLNFSDNGDLKNPMDLEGDATSKDYEKALSEYESSEADLIICIITPQSITDTQKIAEVIINSKLKIKNLIALFMGGSDSEEAIKKLTANKIPAFQFMEHAVEVVKNWGVK
jgi:acetyltransferase